MTLSRLALACFSSRYRHPFMSHIVILSTESRPFGDAALESQSGKFVPDKSNIWRDCVDGMYDWVKEHIEEGAPLNAADACGDPPLLLAAGNGAQCPSSGPPAHVRETLF